MREEYDTHLRSIIHHNNRRLYLLQEAGINIGLANYYYIKTNLNVLNIAEFYIVPSKQQQGYGRAFFRLLLQAGVRDEATLVSGEVDKDLPYANRFWSRLELNLNATGSRNVYSGQFRLP